MMRTLFFLLLLTCFSCRQPDLIYGRYEQSRAPLGGTSYIMHRDGSFAYVSYSCTEKDTGNGRFFQHNDSLIFIYEKTTLRNATTSVTQHRSSFAKGDSVDVKVIVTDKNTGEILPFVIINIFRKDSAAMIRGTMTDLFGEAIVRLPVVAFPVKFTLRTVDQSQYEWECDSPANYEMRVDLETGFPVHTVPEGTKQSFHIASNTGGTLLLDSSGQGCPDSSCNDTIRLVRYRKW